MQDVSCKGRLIERLLQQRGLCRLQSLRPAVTQMHSMAMKLATVSWCMLQCLRINSSVASVACRFAAAAAALLVAVCADSCSS
jgi:hypothetical protein